MEMTFKEIISTTESKIQRTSLFRRHLNESLKLLLEESKEYTYTV